MARKGKPTDVDAFVAAVKPPRREIVVALRKLVRETASGLQEAVKYHMPVYIQNGIVCYIMPAKDHVNLGFYDGVDMKDPNGLLEGTGKRLRHVKVRTAREARNPALRALVREAVRVNAKA